MKQFSEGLTRHFRCLGEVRRRKDQEANDKNGISEPRDHRKTIIATSNGYKITEYIQDKS